uniref:Uncharacterized protein n=1 Tax=Picea glauca TaxID=3330 RepID=A0A101LU80_PICGL|nr:hypothetical protein ABT39_MTgene3419 [Picea glauca]
MKRIDSSKHEFVLYAAIYVNNSIVNNFSVMRAGGPIRSIGQNTVPA